MTWEKTPWFVGGGAWNQATAARLVGYVAFNGNEGILGATDLKVTAQASPNNTVQVATGACCVIGRASGQLYQAYAGRMTAAENVNISATSGSARHDLVVAQIEDPYVDSAFTAPPDPTVAQFIYTRVIAGVPAGTTDVASLGLGKSAIALARIDIPSSTSNITNAMIVDVRALANPRTQRVLKTHALVSGEESILSNTGPYPTGAEFPATIGHWSIYVPPWATQAVILGTWSGILAPPGTTENGYLWIVAGSVTGQGIGWDTSGGTANSRITIVAGDTISIPSGMRGSLQTFTMKGEADTATPTSGRIQATSRSAVALDVQFLEVPV